MTGGLEAVKSIAKEQNKNLLIDTYASWCIPCKRMDKIFEQKKVGDFFNANYLTYRVNMDGPYGAAVKADYQVVFLPTIIIIGPDGEVKYKVDREMTADELISIGELALQPGIKIASDATGFRRNGELYPEGQTYTQAGAPAASKPVKKQPTSKPPKKKKKADVAAATTPSAAEAKIVHVLGKGEVPPPILREEAYFRLELMDDSHKATAKQYLATQKNWNTADNMRFVLDFVSSTDSEEYKHIIKNKARYEEVFGQRAIDQTLQVLVYRRLYKGIPRPDQQEVQRLYQQLGYENPRTMSYKYFISRYEADADYQNMYTTYMQYHQKVVVLDTVGLTDFTDYLSEHQEQYDNNQLKDAAAMVAQKYETTTPNINLKALEARLLVLAGECKKAKKVIKKATKAARKQELDTGVLADVVIACDA